MKIKLLLKKIKQSKNVAVFGHQSPDGDCLGSISAICFLCKKYNKKVDAYVDDVISKKYEFLNLNFIKNENIDLRQYDLIISVDVASLKLLGKYGNSFIGHKNSIVIDHHYNRDLLGTINYIDIKKASCCEIIYEIIKASKQKIDSHIATLLYLGIADDTGCFVHDNTEFASHLIASELFKLGANYKLINYNIFKLTTQKTFDITNKLNNIMKFVDGVRYVMITIDFMKENDFIKHDIGDYVNKLVNLENTKIAFVMTEKQKSVYSINLRSLINYDVSKVAQKFNGGGHKQAAGGEVRGKLDDCEKAVVNECLNAIKQGDNNV